MAPPLPFAVRCDAFSLCSQTTANKHDSETMMKRFCIYSRVHHEAMVRWTMIRITSKRLGKQV
jgi:hypothetical protein